MSNLSARENIIAALFNEIPDYVPCCPDISNMIPARMTEKPFWDMPASQRLFLVFGAETRGLPETILSKFHQFSYYIPITRNARSLNLSTAVGIALYESLRRSRMEHFWKSRGSSDRQ